MFLTQLKNQLIRDLKANWQKSAILGVLLVVGLFFWIPMLLRAVQGEETAAIVAVVPPPPTSAANASPTPALATTVSGAPVAGPVRWRTLAAAYRDDSLAQPVNIDAIDGDPFQLDLDQFPVPGIFAEEEPPPKPIARPAPTVSAELLQSLILKSTVVSSRRRAAMINDRLYREGDAIVHRGITFRLQSVQPRKVVLSYLDTTWELPLAASSDADRIQIQRRPAE